MTRKLKLKVKVKVKKKKRRSGDSKHQNEGIPHNGVITGKQGSMWNDSYYLRVYELASQGMTKGSIAASVGITDRAFRAWFTRRPHLHECFDRGRAKHEGKTGASGAFNEYVCQHLPERLRPIWDEVEALEATGEHELKEALLQRHGKRARQHLFIYALASTNFNATDALKLMNISYATYRDWISEEEFKELMKEIHFLKKNFFEDKLIQLVDEGDTAATVFVNKTFNRDRGYNDRVEHVVSGEINHQISIDALDLSMDARKELLDAMRARRQRALPSPRNGDHVLESEVIDGDFTKKELGGGGNGHMHPPNVP